MSDIKKPTVTPEINTPAAPESLDGLLEVLNKDDLRHVIGGGRSAVNPPFRSITQ